MNILLIEEIPMHIPTDIFVKRQRSFNSCQTENSFNLDSHLVFFFKTASIVRV